MHDGPHSVQHVCLCSSEEVAGRSRECGGFRHTHPVQIKSAAPPWVHQECTRNVVDQGEFADNVVLLAYMRLAASAAIRAYVDVVKAFGLTVSVPNTKFMVVGSGVSEEEKLPLALDDGLTEWVI